MVLNFRLYGRLLSCLGFLTKSDPPVIKKPSDFDRDAKAIMRKTMDDCRGRVLVLDEAYMLINDDSGKQVLDTIVDRTGARLHFRALMAFFKIFSHASKRWQWS